MTKVSDTTGPDEKCVAWLSTADSSGKLSWVVGYRTVSCQVVGICLKYGWAARRTKTSMEITDAGRIALGRDCS